MLPVSDRDALAATHARQAIEDPHALACIGGFHSSQVMAAAPVLGGAGLALIAPAPPTAVSKARRSSG